jgi:thiosulfate/3-mercaptopyruvate sulfurtransferase
MLIIEPNQLANISDRQNAVFVDLNDEAVYKQRHLDSAIHLNLADLVKNAPPVLGLLPDERGLIELINHLGIQTQHDIYAYDDEGGNRAARLLWTLDVLGHHGKLALINGGAAACLAAGIKLSNQNFKLNPGRYDAKLNDNAIADKAYLLANLQNRNTVIVDCRSSDEYHGRSERAMRSGHIPGAVHIDWTSTLNHSPYRHLKKHSELKQLYTAQGVTPDKEIIVYCHSNNRSAHTYMVLKALGYPNVKAYNGGWSEWGNLADTPVKLLNY